MCKWCAVIKQDPLAELLYHGPIWVWSDGTLRGYPENGAGHINQAELHRLLGG